jgi:response regulator RpfG family c-di-GMP phosphodiesterase
MTSQKQDRILFVDDEPHLLAGIKRNFHKTFNIVTATSGADGLDAIKSGGPFAVVVSDMQMPKMNGSQFLEKVKEISPDSVKIMLTGDVGQQTAVAAINKGDVYRFLNKPCDMATLKTTLLNSLEEYATTKVENEILEKTVQGFIQLVVEFFSVVKPDIFGRSNGLAKIASELASISELRSNWVLNTSCLLSQIGCLTLEDAIVNKLAKRMPLSRAEMAEYYQHLVKGANMISKIPKLESVANIIENQLHYLDGTGFPEDQTADIPLESKLLRISSDLEVLLANGNRNMALAGMKKLKSKYEPVFYESALIYLESLGEEQQTVVKVSRLTDSMILAEDVIDKYGVLLVCKNSQAGESVRIHLQKAQLSGLINDVVTIHSKSQ